MHPDIVITDLVMPRLNGVELTKRLREELPTTKIILMSSYTEDASGSWPPTVGRTPS